MTLDIMLPFYGSEALLREAVDSVLAQEDGDWRLTVIDDAYPDPAAGGWVAELDDERVRYLRNPVNLGVGGAFQRSLDLATQDWVVIMGGDDRMLPSFVGRMRAAVAAHPDVAFVQPGVRVIDAQGRPAEPLADRMKARYRLKVDRPTVVDPKRLTESLLRGNWMYFPATMWHRETIAAVGFEERYDVVLDWWLQLQLLDRGARVLLDPEVTFEYRRHAEQVSTSLAFEVTRFHEEKALNLHVVEQMRARGWRRARRRAAWHLSSRLHAALILVRMTPQLVRGRQRQVGRELFAHATSNRWPPGDWPPLEG